MKYCGIDATCEVVYPEAAAKKFKGKVFKSYTTLAKLLKPNEAVTVRVNSTGKFGGMLGYGEVTGVDKNGSYSVPRMLAHDF